MSLTSNPTTQYQTQKTTDHTPQLKQLISDLYNPQHQQTISELRIYKQTVLQQLQQLISAFVISTSHSKHIPPLYSQHQLRFCTFGSFKLQVDLPHSDIDLICLFSKNFSLEQFFFKDLFDLLKSTEGVSKIVKIQSSYIGLMKLTFRNVKFDLVYGQIMQHTSNNIYYIQEQFMELLDNEQKVEMIDYRTQIILKGVQNSQMILANVNDQQIFRDSLYVIRFWAKQKGLYSNVLGFLGGIHYAIMVAKVCQQFTTLHSFEIIEKFFKIYSQWDPTKPIFIKTKNTHIACNYFDTINPESKGFIIFGPADMNYNIAAQMNHSSLKLFKRNLIRGSQQLNAIKNGRQSIRLLIRQYDFYTEFNFYIQIKILSNQVDDEFLEYKEMVISKIKHISQMLETVDSIQENQLWTEPTKIQDQNNYQLNYFIGLRIKKNQMLNLQPYFMKFMETNHLNINQTNYGLSIMVVNRHGMQKILKNDKQDNQFNQNCIESYQEQVLLMNNIIINYK